MSEPKYDRVCQSCGTPIYQGVMCAKCHTAKSVALPVPAGVAGEMQVIERITSYLELGGLFNPESMTPQSAVTDLMIDARAALAAANRRVEEAEAENKKMRELLTEILPEVTCRCDKAYTSRGRHEPNSLCYLEKEIKEVLQ